MTTVYGSGTVATFNPVYGTSASLAVSDCYSGSNYLDTTTYKKGFCGFNGRIGYQAWAYGIGMSNAIMSNAAFTGAVANLNSTS